MVEYSMDHMAAPSDSPLCIAIFGGSGDLAMHRILPALYKLWTMDRLPARFSILGLARGTHSCDQYRDLAATAIRGVHGEAGQQELRDFTSHLGYIACDLDQAEAYRLLAENFTDPAQSGLFYLACAPEHFGQVARQLAAHGLAGRSRPTDGTAAATRAFRRLVIEKPFGTDLVAARRLNRLLHEHYEEHDLFRIDHYLGKDAVQNLIYFRFANTIFEPLWNRKYIDRVEIVLAESGGIGSRGGYYDRAGASRDMLQNHLMQLFCLTAMETPEDLSAAAVREAKVRLLRDAWLPAHSPELPAYLRGQYGDGPADSPGRPYRDEALVAEASSTETFVALKLYVDNWRWHGVPFILKTGKALDRRYGEITIHFRQCPIEVPGAAPDANRLVLRIQPEEGVAMRFNTKAPGGQESEHEELVGMLRDSASAAPGPYERLLGDALRGDSTLFIRFDETEEAWRLLEPMLRAWEDGGDQDLVIYPYGSTGPDLSRLYRQHPLWEGRPAVQGA